MVAAKNEDVSRADVFDAHFFCAGANSSFRDRLVPVHEDAVARERLVEPLRVAQITSDDLLFALSEIVETCQPGVLFGLSCGGWLQFESPFA